MHQIIGLESACSTSNSPSAVDGITLHRDPQTDEWVFDLSPGLDLLEVIRVLAVVQQHALSLVQKQLQTPLPPNANAPVVTEAMPAMNQFAQL